MIEAGPDSFLSQKPWALDLCRRLGLSDQLIDTKASQEKAFVFSRGRLRPLPDGLVVVVPTRLGPFLRSGVLSFPGMMRMAMDLVIPRRRGTDQDESLASFFRRRLGREAFERLVEPLMAGIYAGDAAQISVRATFPRFLEMEQQHGSLIRGILAGRRVGKSGSRDGAMARTTFVTLRGGLSTLTGALVAQLEKAGVKLMAGQRVIELRLRSDQPDGMYALFLESGEVVSADAVVLATPAYVSASCIRSLDPGAADLLDAIPYAST
ncbi:MAG: protoporphyrinogen oxidase, partial [Nitrospiraceae bacterium]